MNKKILITGANGQLGRALSKQYPDAVTTDSEQLDITNLSQVEAYPWRDISTIINTAAYTNVDAAETPEGRVASWSVNALGAANLASVAIQHELTLVHISTDYVFDGTKDKHLEEEPFSPLNVYGQSKAAGDIAVALSPKHYILRTSWVIGDGNNFVRTMIGLANKNINPTVVADQIGRPTFTIELVRAIGFLMSHEATYGTYNLSNAGQAVSWADLARAIFRLAGKTNITVTDTTTEQYFASKPNVALRPLNSTFNLSKLGSIGYTPHEWEDDLKLYLQEEAKR